MPPPPHRLVAAVVRSLGSRSAVADLLAVPRATVDAWLASEGTPSASQQRVLTDIALVHTALARHREVPAGWFRSPCPTLDGATPEDVLVVEGAARVLDAIARELR